MFLKLTIKRINIKRVFEAKYDNSMLRNEIGWFNKMFLSSTQYKQWLTHKFGILISTKNLLEKKKSNRFISLAFKQEAHEL